MSQVTEIPKLNMQQQVDTCQALLDMDDLQKEGLVEGFCITDRNKCLQLLARAKRRGYVPGPGRWGIGRGLLEMAGGKFTESGNPQTTPEVSPSQGKDQI